MTKNKDCGLIMPISSIDGCSSEHWMEVKEIITEAVESIEKYNFKVSLVSDADDVGVIQKRIVQNVYNSDIVVCDVSGKNPNVMFELGMRLAFDKPTVIIKDDKTNYSFDTGIIEHITYPRDLRFSNIVTFKEGLADKVIATLEKSESDPDHSTFLKNFGKFHVANLSEDVVSSDKVVIEMLTELQSEVSSLRNRVIRNDKLAKNSSVNSMNRKIRSSINLWQRRESCDTSDMLGNEEFYNYIEKRVGAPEYYNSREEFEDAVNTILLDPAA
ncbi:hypothetical protein [Endozoicomonas lisbonensis]|uniref:RNA helicase n=1 Tax=Endozoicomonas lisbonensis TaxID=3120522 RepID=A0ABV2SF73_9GAMM